jgi:UDP-N-acetylglucosamine--N-acetylmuramyl-(pentapeptide) pyrophosphoryl-undecaprenol N-acetylglucosamine transferase
MRVIIAGGGTGGHVIPALAIAQQLKKQFAAEVLFIGTARGIETRLVPQAGFPLQLIKVGALKNVSLMTRARTMFDLPRALWTAGRMVSDFRPDVVIGVGGYASGPAMLAAIRRRIPTLAFEPNVVPGFANRLVAHFVSAAAVHFEETCEYFSNCKVTGVPVREAFFNISAKSAGNENVPTVLVFGGSQGAHAINQAMIESLPGLRAKVPAIHIIHQTGQRDYEMVLAAYQRLGMTKTGEAPVAPLTLALRERGDYGTHKSNPGGHHQMHRMPELRTGLQAGTRLSGSERAQAFAHQLNGDRRARRKVRPQNV